MPISITDYFKINKEEFNKTEAFDAILDIDSLLFIDPILARRCTIKEFKDADKKVKAYFNNVLKLLSFSNEIDDLFWKKADKLLKFPENKGTCLGYSRYSTSGNGMGPRIRRSLLITIKKVIEAGEKEPEIFELIGIFQEKIGCDRISDMLTKILMPQLCEYSQRVFSLFKGIELQEINIDGTKYLLPLNPFNHKPIILVPKQILRDLPIAFDFDDIDIVCAQNELVRTAINDMIGNEWGKRQKLNKNELHNLFENNETFRKELINNYKNSTSKLYDFEIDPAGEVVWYQASVDYTKNFPIKLSLSQNPTEKEIELIVNQICEQFALLIEDNNLWRLLYDDKTNPKHESAAQLLFFGISSAYCQANNLDISKEPNNGRGPVDFKFSHGYYKKIIVEVKLSSNNQLIHCLNKQIPIYQKQENIHRAIYLLLDVGNQERINNLYAYYNNLNKETKQKIQIIRVDANPKKSASKA